MPPKRYPRCGGDRRRRNKSPQQPSPDTGGQSARTPHDFPGGFPPPIPRRAIIHPESTLRSRRSSS
jgi:hypothetical protein